MNQTILYFESHVTLDPCEGERLEALKRVAERHGFRVGDVPDDSFCTARDESFGVISGVTAEFCRALTANGFVVRRYKIENTLVDSNVHDQFGLLPAVNADDCPF